MLSLRQMGRRTKSRSAHAIAEARRRIALVVIALAACLAPAYADDAPPAAAGIDPSIGKVEVTLDLPKDKPYVGEMIMMRMRSFVRADIVLDELRQPPLTNFDWQQLGRDRPIEAMVDGFRVAGIERDIAIFPQQAGRLIIDPFVRHVTIATSDNRRVVADFASKPVFVDVQNHTGIGAPDAWWLPAKSLSLIDNWSVEPDEIKPGTLSRRTVTVQAVGLTADRLPPEPKMLAPGTIVFKGPAKRETIITEDGPIARATYAFDIRPVSASPAKMPAIHIPWYDTTERRMRDAAIPDTWVAYVGTLVHAAHEKPKSWQQIYFAPGPVAAGVAGFAWTGAFVGFALTARRRPSGARRRRAKALRMLARRARFNDESGFRRALDALAQGDPVLWSQLSRAPLIAARLGALDAACYGRTAETAPSLPRLAADIRSLSAELDEEKRDTDVLPSLDGPSSQASVSASPEGVWRRVMDRRARSPRGSSIAT